MATSAASSALPPAIEWSKTYDGYEATSVDQTGDGGYIVAGYTFPVPGEADGLLVKTDKSGNVVWRQTYGGSKYDRFEGVLQAGDGGYVAAGFTISYGAGEEDFWLVKTNANGSMQWSQTFGGKEADCAYSVQQTSDGGYVVAGYTFNYGVGNSYDQDPCDAWLVKTTSSGGFMWSRNYGGVDPDYAMSVDQTSDGGYIVAGYTNTYLSDAEIKLDAWLIKVSSSGNVLWNQKYGGAGHNRFSSVQHTGDGGCIAAGNAAPAGNSDAWLVRVNASGGIAWSQTYGGSKDEGVYSVDQTSDGGCIVAGYVNTAGYGDLWAFKTNITGSIQWSQTYGGAGSEYAHSVQQTSDGGYIFAGRASNILLLLKFEGVDADGDGLLDDWEKNGIDYPPEDGIIDLNLPALGANWQHKDLFVEVDYMSGHSPDLDAMSDVESAFANAPVTNPDGIPGIRLHIDVDEQIPHQDLIKRDFTKGFDGLKDLYFGTVTQRSALNSLDVLDAKKLVYRYCMFVHKISQWNGTQDVETTYAGLGEMPGNDFIIAAGSFVGGLKTIRDDHAGGFMHELGHNLGLNHGGDFGDDINFKPNYLSVMNYAFTFSTLVPWRPLDYSRKELFALYEGSLDETYGIQASGFWQYTVWNDSKRQFALGLVSEPLDWNGNGNKTERSVRANINNFPKWGYNSAADEVLFGYDDWANVKLAFGDTSQFAHGVHLQMSGDEITSDIVEAMRQSVLVMHEVAVFNLTSSSAIWSQGNVLSVNLTLGNLGGSDENVNVAVYANSTEIASYSLIVKSGNLTEVMLPYTGQALSPGVYLLKATVNPVAGETYTADNTVTGDSITVTDVIPEFPPLTLLAALIVLTLTVSLAFRRKTKN